MSAGVVVPVTNIGVRWAAAAAVPSGFTDSPVANITAPTAVAGLPDGTVVVLSQPGSVRLIRGGVLLPNAALTLSIGGCNGGERGLLGFATDRDFKANGFVYIYYTRPASAPGNCVNRASRFTMAGDVIDPNSEVVLVDNISSNAGNHNGGDLEIGGDGYLYISVGDAGRDPRGRAGANVAAQDLSLLNGKILRVVPSTGEPAPGNPISGPNSASCRDRGNLPSTPDTPCQELFAWGLRNPFRFAFDPNTGPDRFFINDVGQNTREEVDLGGIGLNYGWPAREGQCPTASNPPCAGPAGFVDPITDYPRGLGQYITAGAFIPSGHWPAQYDGGYLFADGGSGNMWLLKADGSVDYANPFATGAQSIADMAFVPEGGTYSLYYTLSSGSVRKITNTVAAPASPAAPLTFRSLATATRALDTRLPASGSKPVRAGATRYVPLGVDPSVTKAALVNFAFVEPSSSGYLTAWAGRRPRQEVSNLNAAPGEVVANSAVVPVDANGGILVYAFATAHVVIDVLGYFDVALGATTAGRFVAVPPTRITDTREPSSPANQFTRGVGASLPYVRVPVAGRGELPAVGAMDSAVLVVTAISGADNGGGFLSATAGGATFSGTSNLNTNGLGDIRPNLVVVPVGADGTVDLHLLSVPDVAVDVAGYFTSASAPSGTAGRFHVIDPYREVDTRANVGFGRLPGQASASIDPATAPADAQALAQNITIVDNAGPGFVTPYPGGTRPLISAGNASGSGQPRAVLSFTQLSATPATMSYFTLMATDLVVDTPGYFEGG